MFRQDPGPCSICGAPHCSCGGGPILVEQLPATAAAAGKPAIPVPPELVQDLGLQAGAGPLGDGADGRPFSTATYRGDPKKRRR